jgi:cobalt-zinc-cadmium efflux system membrane fusion protein
MNRTFERRISTLAAAILFAVCALALMACGENPGSPAANGNEPQTSEHPDHEEHGEEEHGESEGHDDHKGHGEAGHDDHDEEVAQDEHEGHDEHDEDEAVRLDEHQLESIDIIEAEVTRGALSQTLSLAGEIQWNPDLVVHITPRVGGIVREVKRTLGDSVKTGDVMAVLDSPEIGRARMDYLEARGRLEQAMTDRERVETVARNTRRLMEVLDAHPSSDAALDQAADLQIGEYKTRLMNAYTTLQVATRNWERETKLREKQISSEADYLEALGGFETARSNYQSLRESIDYELEQELVRVRNAERIATSGLLNADRTLHILGLDQDQIDELEQRSESLDDSISRVGVRAPIDGLVVDRHLSPGEQVGPDSDLYKLADTSEVWFMARAYEGDLRRLETGLKAVVLLDAWPGHTFEGALDYIGSELDPDTRTLPARVVIPNPEGRLKSGLFGRVAIMAQGPDEGLLVPSNALQRTADGHIVFRILEAGVFESVPVRVLEQGDEFAQVQGELRPGDRLAAGDTLTLMTEARRGALGGGHSH